MRRWLLSLTSLLPGVLAAIAAPAASAWTASNALPCAPRTEAQVFRPWGDTSTWFLGPNGSFSSSLSTTWATVGVVDTPAENEPWNVSGASTARSVRLAPGAQIWMRPICVTATEDRIRAFVKRPGIIASSLKMVAVSWNPRTLRYLETPIWISGTAPGWTPTPVVQMTDFTNSTGTQLLGVYFVNEGLGSWQIDDVYVDPFKCCG